MSGSYRQTNGSVVPNCIPGANSINGTNGASPNGVGTILNNETDGAINGAKANGAVSKNGHGQIRTESMKSKNSIEDDGIYQVRTQETRVLVIYTGGTIGMQRDSTGALAPASGVLAERVRALPQMHDAEYAANMIGEPGWESTLVLPDIEHHGMRIIYKIFEWEPLTDSSDMSIDDWIKIAKDIEKNYTSFDGFVVLHGTDTMSYTASALSFMLENLGKPVVVTGSQIPIFEPRSDGADNFVSALIIASTHDIPEVTLFFGNKLFRGNRSSKVSADNFDAFNSPNCEPLAVSGLTLQVDSRAVFRPSAIQAFRAHTQLDRDVAPVRVFPSITGAAVRAYLQPPIKGVVLETYGAGNIPSNRADIHEALKGAVERGVLIVNITQCSRGSVKALYKTGQFANKFGIVSGYDMTPEAALTKLSYVLSKDEWDFKTKCMMMETSIRGELTNGKSKAMDFSVIDAVGRCVGVTSAKEAASVAASSVMPALLTYAAVNSRPDLVDNLLHFGADVCSSNFDGRSALHVAACLGELPVMERLLHGGANVHLKDRYGNTPLMDAIHCEQEGSVATLMRCGAHLGSADWERTAQEVTAAASRGLVHRLSLYKKAGAYLAATDIAGRTALHVAALLGHEKTVEYLLSAGLSHLQQDAFGLTPVDYAQNGGHYHILNVFKTASDGVNATI